MAKKQASSSTKKTAGAKAGKNRLSKKPKISGDPSKKRNSKKARGVAAKKVAGRMPVPRRGRQSSKVDGVGDRKHRAGRIIAELRELYPEADCELERENPLELLIATILSAQSTDETVNKVTPKLFARFKSVKELAKASSDSVEEIIRPTGFFRQKTKSIQGACRMIADEFNGRVPDTMEDLVKLPGVARKTANVVLGTAFGKNEGFVVDTHIGRLATRLDLTWTSKDSKDAVKIEQDLMGLIPREDWTWMGHALIWHGRRVCYARKPNCAVCTLATDCPSAGRV